MAKFSDRIFGNNVHPDVIKIFDNLQKGSFQKEPLEEAQPTHQDYIGDRTTFARMWTASLISGSIVDEEGKPDGTTQEVVFNVVNDNRDDSYVEINEPVGDLISKELTDNPYLKPKAGIRSVTTRNEGSLGVIKNTKVEFTVHNKKDFEEIFLPFFMKPGATVVVDYGWSDKSFQLYDVKKQVENTDLELSEFKKYIYGSLKFEGKEDIVYQNTDGNYYYYDGPEVKQVEYQEGFLEKNIGLVDTIIGIVKGYDATVNQQGSFECSIDLVSQNTTLLDQEITEENNLKFIFANRIEDAIINVLLGEGSSVNANLRYINSLGSQAKQSLLNDFFEEKLEISQPDKQDLGIIPKKAVKLGLFYQNVTHYNSGTNDRDLLYISFGRFEDLFLNSLVAKTDSDRFKSLATKFDFHDSFVRFDDNLFNRQKELIESKEPLPVFLYPHDWSKTYNTVSKTSTRRPVVTNEDLRFRVDSTVFTSGYSTRDEVFAWNADSDMYSPAAPPHTNDHYRPYRIKAGTGKRLFTIDTYIAPEGSPELSPPTLDDVIGYFAAAKNKDEPVSTFVVYTQHKLKDAEIPTAAEIIAANENDLKDKSATSTTPLQDQTTYRVYFRKTTEETIETSARVQADRSENDGFPKRIPLRDIFISVKEIQKAFMTKQNINDAVDFLLESINRDSYDVLKLKMYSRDRLHSSISAQDANLLPLKDKSEDMLIFDVTSDRSIVSNLDYKFETPKGGLASMIAIGDKTETKLFDEMTRDNLNFLKVLETNRFVNKDGPDKVFYKSLPLNERSEGTESKFTEVVFDFNSIASKKVRADAGIALPTAADFATMVDEIKSAHGHKNSAGFGPTIPNENEGKEKQEEKKQIEEYLGLGLITSNSLREYYGKLARASLIYSGQDSSISPVLPINLSLTVYGNTYLNNGDIFNINFLPKAYEKRVYFQIIGVEQKLETSGWQTTYSTLMRVNPLFKSDTHDVAEVILSKMFAKRKLMEGGQEYIHGLLEVIKKVKPITDLPHGYGGFLMEANYETKGLKEYDEQREKDSRLLQNKFSPPKTLEDISYIYAVTATLYNYLSEYSFDEKNKLRVFIPTLDKVGNMGSIGIWSGEIAKFALQIFVLVADKTASDESVMYTNKKIKDWKKNPQSKFLEGVIADRAQQNLKKLRGSNKALLSLRRAFAVKQIKKFYDEYVLKQPNGVFLENPGNQDLIKSKSTKGVINGFNFRLGNYGDKGDKSFYSITVEKGNLGTIDSLKIPKWFLGKKSIKDFLSDIDNIYVKILSEVEKGFGYFEKSKS